MGIRRMLATVFNMPRTSLRIFSNTVLKDEEGNEVLFREKGRKYFLYSKETGKKVGWVRTSKYSGGTGFGYCNLLAYHRMPKVSKGQLLQAQLRSAGILD